MTRKVKSDTNAIRADASDIKQEIAKIRDDIERLRLLSSQSQEWKSDAGDDFPYPMMQRYLDDLTSYAETVREDIQYQTDPEILMICEILLP